MDSATLFEAVAAKENVAGLRAASDDNADIFVPDARVRVLPTFLYR
jgi:hypothetical protein